MFLFSCGHRDNNSTELPDNSEKVTIDQGVWGNVWFWAGNHMPVDPTGTITPVVRDIYIYEEATLQDVTPGTSGTFFASVNTNLITIVTSDSTGFYQAELQPGIYSVFVKENDKFYANGFGLNGIINPVTVEENSVTKLQIDITYAASF